MKTYLDCIPCFFKQAIEASRISGAGKRAQRRILNELAGILPQFSLNSSPPEMGRIIYKMIKSITKKKDMYSKIKKKNNELILGVYDKLEQKVDLSSDRLETAVKLAISGNIIDYGVKNSLNVNEELEKILRDKDRIIENKNRVFFNYAEFKKVLRKAKTILYLADNAGEIVFDRILIEEIKRVYKDKRIIYAVKESPIINDALAEDAYACGIDKLAQIISSGSDAPGTILSLCSKEFLKIFREADMIITKGQGNFEALSCVKRPVFFLFIAKCQVIAKHIGCRIGDIILLYHNIKKV